MSSQSCSINPLQLISDFVNDHVGEEYPMDMHSREYLLRWFTTPSDGEKKCRQVVYDYSDEQVQLAVDCLIAAGLSDDASQTGTVYCRASY